MSTSKRSYRFNDGSAEMHSNLAPPRKKARTSILIVERSARPGYGEDVCGRDAEECCGRDEAPRDCAEDREPSTSRIIQAPAVAPSSIARAAAIAKPSKAKSPAEDREAAPSIIARAPAKPTRGVILRSGRIRLPDKLMQYLNNAVTPSCLFWQSDGQGFSMDCENIQTELLDKYFHGTKLSSFLRSLNRWGFKRLFYHSMPKSTLSFHHPLFRQDSPDLCKDMNMAACSSGSGATTGESKKKVKQAPAPVVEPEAKPVAAASSQATSLPVQAETVPVQATTTAAVAPQAPATQAPSMSVQPQHPVASVGVQSLQDHAAQVSTNADLYAALGQMRAQIAAEAASKDLLLSQAMAAAEQQRNVLQNSALAAQASSNNNTHLLQSLLTSLVGGGQQVATNPSPQLTSLVGGGQQVATNPSPQLVALATALSSGARAPTLPPVAAPPQQAPPTSSLLQMLTPSQQLELLNRLNRGQS